MTNALDVFAVIPSTLQVGEKFSIKIKVLGEIKPIHNAGGFNDVKPRLYSPFNLNHSREIQYHDNCLSKWKGKIQINEEKGFYGPKELIFDGINQGVFDGDSRPIKEFEGYSFDKPGFHFISLYDPESGVRASTNPTYVSIDKPKFRIYWGDLHWQTFFSDGIRCPEELYSFARNEAFLDFGAISDHMEAVTDRQWDYFKAVTNDYNEPERFPTLLGQEWTHHNKNFGSPGHRNIYYRGNDGPVLRSTDPKSNSLDRLWKELDSLDIETLVIPHHSANVVMGVDWEQGWNPKYEKSVEIYSVWGSSEKHKDDGNTRPIVSANGEMKGRHIVDALKKGYRLGFIGGGDIHDGRPGDDLHSSSYPDRGEGFKSYHQGFTAILAPELTRESVFDSISNHKTYATTKSRIYLDCTCQKDATKNQLNIKAASSDGIKEVAIVFNGKDIASLKPSNDSRFVERSYLLKEMNKDDFCYLRVFTKTGEIAWSSPIWGR